MTILRQQSARSLDKVASIDSLTVGSIGILAYMLGNVLHEAVGHGGACLLSGAKPLVLSSVHFECSLDNRLVIAGGTLVTSSRERFFTLDASRVGDIRD